MPFNKMYNWVRDLVEQLPIVKLYRKIPSNLNAALAAQDKQFKRNNEGIKAAILEPSDHPGQYVKDTIRRNVLDIFYRITNPSLLTTDDKKSLKQREANWQQDINSSLLPGLLISKKSVVGLGQVTYNLAKLLGYLVGEVFTLGSAPAVHQGIKNSLSGLAEGASRLLSPFAAIAGCAAKICRTIEEPVTLVLKSVAYHCDKSGTALLKPVSFIVKAMDSLLHLPSALFAGIACGISAGLTHSAIYKEAVADLKSVVAPFTEPWTKQEQRVEHKTKEARRRTDTEKLTPPLGEGKHVEHESKRREEQTESKRSTRF